MSAKDTDSPAWISQLSSLDAHLRALGFSVSPDRWLNIGDLLLSLQYENNLPDDVNQARQIISPLICKSAREQEEFQQVFAQWWRDKAEEKHASEKNELPVATSGVSTQYEAVEDVFSTRRIRTAFIVLVALVALFFYWDEKKRSPAIESDNLQSDILSIDNSSNSDKAPAPTSEPPPEAANKENRSGGERSSITSDISVLSVPPRSPLENKGELPPLKTLSAFSNTLFYVVWALLIFGFPLFCLLLFFRGALRQTLRKKKGDLNSPLSHIRLLLENDKLFDGPSIRKAIKRLHYPAFYATRRLQTEKTVDASVRHGGLFTPVYAERAEVPEVIVWINNRGRFDPIQALANTFVERLQSSDLRVHSYSYQKKPDRLLHRKTQQWMSQLDVISHHPGARIVIVASAENLFDDSTGSITQWLLTLSNAHSVVVLETSRFQPNVAKKLRKNGISLAPFSSVGINYLFSEMTATPFVAENQVLPLLPDVLANTVRWRVPVPPTKKEKQALLNTLEAYLGAKGFTLFTAVTAYPEFRWALVRALDLRMNPNDAPLERESRLLAIAQLPWSRDGWLPDWLRLLLLRRADKNTRREIRENYEHLIVNAESAKDEVAVLPVRVSPVSSELRGFIRDIFRWCKKGSALEDGVFVELMLGKRLSRLDFELPRALDKIVPLSYTARNLFAGLGVLLFSALLVFVSYFLLSSIGFETKAKEWLLTREGRQYPIQAKFVSSEQSFALVKQLSEISSPSIVAQQLSASEMTLPEVLTREAYSHDGVIFFKRNYEAEARWLEKRIQYLGYGMAPMLIQVDEALPAFAHSPIYVVLNRNYSSGEVFRDKVVHSELDVDSTVGLSDYTASNALRILMENQFARTLQRGVSTAPQGSATIQSVKSPAEVDQWEMLGESFSLLNGYQQLFNQKLRDVDYLATFATRELIEEYGSLEELKRELLDEQALGNRLYNQDLVDQISKQLSVVPAAYLVYAEARHLFFSRNLQSTETNRNLLDGLPLTGVLKRFFSVSTLINTPAYLTRKHYLSFQKNYIPLAMSGSEEKIRQLGNVSGDILSSEELFTKVKSIYIDNYIKTWQQVVDTFVVGNLFGNTPLAAGLLDALSRENNNIFHLLMSSLSRQFFDESLYDEKINRAFESYQLALSSDRYEPESQVDKLWSALEPTFKLAQEKLAVNEPQRWAHQFALTEFNDSSPSVLGELLVTAQNAPQPMRRWMLSVLEQFWRAQLDDAQLYIQLQWQQVLAQCKASVEGKFPLQREAAAAVSLSDFSRFFDEGGIEDGFSKEYIEPYISSQSNTTQYGYMLFFDLDALKQSAQADKIRRAYFSKGQYRRHDFRIRFKYMPAELRAVTLIVDRKSQVRYLHGPTVWKSLNWLPQQNSEVSLDIVDTAGTITTLDNRGGWSLLRLFQSHDLKQAKTGMYNLELKNGNSAVATVELNFADDSELLDAFLQPSYSCVDRLFLGDDNG